MPRVLLLLLLLLLAPASASAKTGPCTPGDRGGPRCHWWEGKVKLVADGDTLHVDVAGEGRQEVRFIGVNTMELRVYSQRASRRRGDCMGVPAANLVDRYVKAAKGRVLLAAQRPSSRSGHRVRRSVWVRSKGKLVDLAAVGLEAGYGLFLPNPDEWAHHAKHQRLAGAARAAGKHLWDPRACGGPAPGAKLSVVAKWDADGADKGNVNDEYLEVRNAGTTPVDIGGWWARDSWLNWHGGRAHGIPGFRFEPGTVVPALGNVRLHIGCGAQTALRMHWCQKSDAFENVTYDRTRLGDGAYLFDRKGGLRASFVYPCVLACVDPLRGKVALRVQASGTESVSIRNTSGAPVDLGDHVLKLRNAGKRGEYVFGKVLAPGTVVPAGRTHVHRHPTPYRYTDAGGVVELRTLDDQLTDCFAWGNKRC